MSFCRKKQSLFKPAPKKELPTLDFYDDHLATITCEVVTQLLPILYALGYRTIHFEPPLGCQQVEILINMPAAVNFDFALTNLLSAARKIGFELIPMDLPINRFAEEIKKLVKSAFPLFTLEVATCVANCFLDDQLAAMGRQGEATAEILMKAGATPEEVINFNHTLNRHLSASDREYKEFDKAKHFFELRTEHMNHQNKTSEKAGKNIINLCGYRHTLHRDISRKRRKHEAFHVRGHHNLLWEDKENKIGSEQDKNESKVDDVYNKEEVHRINGHDHPMMNILQIIRQQLAKESTVIYASHIQLIDQALEKLKPSMCVIL